MSSSIPELTIKDKLQEKYLLFFADTETTGCKGIPIWAKQHQTIQLCAYCPEYNSWFKALVKHPEIDFIPEESIESHRITLQDINTNGIEVKQCFTNYIAWVDSLLSKTTNQREAVFICHNAPFDHDMIMKVITEILKIPAAKLKWNWFDTLEIVKKIFPELAQKYFPVERPHSLPTLMEELCPSLNLGVAHNAETDVKSVVYLFDKILERCALLKEDIKIKPLPKPICTTYLKDIHGYGSYRVQQVVDLYNLLTDKPNSNMKFKTSFNLVTAAHLIYYSMTKIRLSSSTAVTPVTTTNNNNNDNDTWFLVAQTMERCMRKELRIYSDIVIVRTLSYMLNITELDFIYHTMKQSGDKNYFPTIQGEPLVYLPFEFSEEESKKILQELGLKSAMEIYIQYRYTPDMRKFAWLQRLNSHLTPLHQLDFKYLQEKFDAILAFGGG